MSKHEFLWSQFSRFMDRNLSVERTWKAHSMMRLLQSTVFATAMASLLVGALAEDKKDWVADASRGLRLSERLCASCHLVRPDQSSAVVSGVPSFRAIAKLPNERVSSTLMRSHSPMPNMQLTRNEIADIIAFIVDLRRKAVGKPPANSTPRNKPRYPSPS
jgi:cytochrome c